MIKQECIPVGCVPSAVVAVSPGRGGVWPQCMLGYQPPPDQTPPPEQTPPRTRHCPPGPDTPQTRHTPGPDTPQDQTPSGTRHPLEQTLPGTRHTPTLDRHACENIAFATSFRTVTMVLLT